MMNVLLLLTVHKAVAHESDDSKKALTHDSDDDAVGEEETK